MSFELKTSLNSQLKTQGEHGGIPWASLRPYSRTTVNYQLSTVNYQLSTVNYQGLPIVVKAAQ
ncbi:MAG: hypothetical protein HC849_10575 [Oscillatoriales cyanobacterium RU_3_3]|nr:hypothetical protein [Microcoleus sp. SU_5_6]NJL67609.1 hypothetical protein [Microcoleus sp. SM1_3_4]NJM60536.1 hypothetical protein [Oscillatoriales cyanobacterium RU_3_3]NJR22734.1 hypothetical protein [Richelia sp. CSU_2_1]